MDCPKVMFYTTCVIQFNLLVYFAGWRGQQDFDKRNVIENSEMTVCSLLNHVH